MSSSFTPLRTIKQCRIARTVSPTTNISFPAAGRRKRSSVSITEPKVLFSLGITARGTSGDSALKTSDCKIKHRVSCYGQIYFNHGPEPVIVAFSQYWTDVANISYDACGLDSSQLQCLSTKCVYEHTWWEYVPIGPRNASLGNISPFSITSEICLEYCRGLYYDEGHNFRVKP